MIPPRKRPAKPPTEVHVTIGGRGYAIWPGGTVALIGKPMTISPAEEEIRVALRTAYLAGRDSP